MIKHTQKNSGFTLLETLIAIVILSTALLLLTNSWGAAFTRLRKTQSAFEVAALLQRKMTEIEMQYRGKAIDDIPEGPVEENFGKEYPQYTWKMASKKLELPDLTATLTSQKGGAAESLMSFAKTLSEGMAKAIKEVTVTVIFKSDLKAKAIEYSVTTYFVDYDKEISFGAPGS